MISLLEALSPVSSAKKAMPHIICIIQIIHPKQVSRPEKFAWPGQHPNLLASANIYCLLALIGLLQHLVQPESSISWALALPKRLKKVLRSRQNYCKNRQAFFKFK